jgi:hypothetical protein
MFMLMLMPNSVASCRAFAGVSSHRLVMRSAKNNSSEKNTSQTG